MPRLPLATPRGRNLCGVVLNGLNMKSVKYASKYKYGDKSTATAIPTASPMAQSDPVIDLTLDYPRAHSASLRPWQRRRGDVPAAARHGRRGRDPDRLRHAALLPAPRERRRPFLERRARCAAALPRRPELPRILLGPRS